MKNLIKFQALTFILVILFTVTYGQESSSGTQKEKKHNTWVGLRIGSDFASPTTNYNEIENQLNADLQLGIYMKFGKKIFIQPELYGQFLFENDRNTRKAIANSVKVPVLLGVEFINLGIANVHLMAGPMGTIYLNPASNKKYDYKLQLGGGIEVLRFISLDIRYAVNLNNNFKEELKQLSWNSGVNVTLGIQFR